MVRLRWQRRSCMLVILALFAGMECNADTHYVSLSGTNNSPYLNWADAATDVTWAVTAAAANDTVLVTNGVYYPTQRCYNASAIALQSVNGRDVTIINGTNNTNICALLGGGAVLDGFTVTNCSNTKIEGLVAVSTVRNCLFVNNRVNGGTVGSASLAITNCTNCIFKNNSASSLAGAIEVESGAGITIAGCHFEGNNSTQFYGGACDIRSKNNVISNCVFINNSAKIYGGALFLSQNTTNNLIINCTFTGNSSPLGSAIKCGGKTTIRNCSIIGNIATNQGGGIYGTNVTIQNCLIARNVSLTNTGGGVWMTNGLIESCTIVSNQAAVSGGGVYITGSDSSGTNNVIYFNTAANGANFTNDTVGAIGLNYSCVIPAVAGTGNITNNPVLKNLAGGDYHLRMTSPCVNAGTNQSWMTNAVDLDGNARILKTIVDMGAYETRIWQGTIFRVPGR